MSNNINILYDTGTLVKEYKPSLDIRRNLDFTKSVVALLKFLKLLELYSRRLGIK